jgi:hypothetical protein
MAVWTHRQDSQQRGLAGVLETDHGDVHLGIPASHEGAASASIIIMAWVAT